MIGSKWDRVLLEISESVKGDLAKCSQKELVTYCVENKATRNSAEDFLKNLKASGAKDSARALEKKEEGNKKYKKKYYRDSLSLYTESIYLANKNDECLPLSYANRSLVLQQLFYPSESLSDMDMAMSCGFPKEKSGKFVLRRAKCYLQLGDIDKAKEILTEGMQKEGEETCKLIESELKQISKLKLEGCPTTSYKLPEPVGGENEDFISASKHLSVYFDEIKGRHVKATEDIEIGNVLFVEKPFAFVTFIKACFNCCKRTVAPIPCWNCTDVYYCSPDCRDEFWKSIHSFECGFADLFKSVGIAHLSLRIVLQASSNLDELKKILGSIHEPEYEKGIVVYRSRDYKSVYNLVHNSDKYEESDMFQYVMTALLLALHLKNHTNYFPSDSDDQDLKLLTSVLCRHILQLICNGHAMCEIWVEQTPNKLVLDKRDERTGTAIYPSASMMNHSCKPSVIYGFHNNILIVRAAKTIKKGEEVFNCYGPHAGRMNRADRQEILTKQYFFKCDCEPCQQTFDIQDKFTAFKCTNCKGPVVLTNENSIDTVCLSCKRSSKISLEIAQKRTKFYSSLKEGEVFLESDDASALKKFLESWWLGREIFYRFHKDLSFAADQAAKCLLHLENFKECVLFLKCCVRSVEERFGSLSFELADEMKRLGDVYTSYVVTETKNKRVLAREGLLYYEKAEKILSILCPEFKELEEIKASKGMLEALIKSQTLLP